MRTSVLGLALLSGCSAFSASGSPLPGLGGGAKSCLSNSCFPLRRSSSLGVTGLRGGVGEGKPKLIYFDARGVAETARVMLLAAGEEYEDDRYKMEMVDGKPSVPKFQEDKKSGALAANMGRLPILDIGTAKFGQSHAINRFVATHHGFMGKTPEDAAIIDCLYESIRDAKDAFSKVRFSSVGTEEEKQAKMEEFWSDKKEGLPEWFNKIEQLLVHYTPEDTGFAYGSSPTLADFTIYTWIESLALNDKLAALGSKPWESYPRVNASYNKVLEMDVVQKWIKERPANIF